MTGPFGVFGHIAEETGLHIGTAAALDSLFTDLERIAGAA